MDEETNQYILRLYLEEKKTGEQIAVQLSLGNTTVYRVLKRAKATRPYCDTNRRYTYDQNFFHNIGSHEKAQILGLLYADGCVSISKNKRKRMTLSLAAVDKTYLEKIKEMLKYEGPLGFLQRTKPNRQDNYRFSLHGDDVCDDLIRLGCVPRKSFTLTFPVFEQVPEEYLSSFMLGYFEGDGSLYVSPLHKDGMNRIVNDMTFSITGTMEFCQVYGAHLKSKCSVSFKIKKRHKNRDNNNFTLIVDGNQQIIRVMSFLYSKATFRMERKWDKFCRVVSSLVEYHQRRFRNTPPPQVYLSLLGAT